MSARPEWDSDESPYSECLCEHRAHLESIPWGNHPMHAYGAGCKGVKPIETIFGEFPMCPECAAELPSELRA